jgi:hypothetical protein
MITSPTNADTDGDGVSDGAERTSSGATDPLTNATNNCSLNIAEQTLTPSAAWAAADCDNDGTPNGTDPQPTNPCIPNTNSAACTTGDTDGDGVSNAQEAIDGTNPGNGCSYTVVSQVYANTTAAWKTLDCDTDGLIYTDGQFMEDLVRFLASQGLALDVSYSEQGMQGDDYVSCDVAGKFIASWEAKFNAFAQMSQ